ncbi:MAG: protein kinase domain-containing protein [Planctomycetota bacterium]|jgi:serine/threonine protein kinase
MPEKHDILFGKIALQKKLLNPEQLREAIFLQASISPPRSIAEILVDKGYLTDSQVTMVTQVTDRKISEETKPAVKPSPSGRKKLTSPFGNLVLDGNLCTEEELERAVEEQERLVSEGKKYRLGQILIMMGILSVAQVQELLSRQEKRIFVCPDCAAKYNISADESQTSLSCRRCGGALKLDEKLDSVSVQPDSDSSFDDSIPPIFDGIPDVITSTKRRIVSDADVRRAEEAKASLGGYEILGEVARGGMGIIYKAHQMMLDRTVALKMLLAGPDASERDAKRFMREAAAIAKLGHNNIVRIYEMKEMQGVPYFTMEYIEGRSLAEILKAGRPDIRTAVRVTRDVADALEYAHANGVLHRDVKPGNIMIESNTGRVVLMDFGLARLKAEDSHVTQIGFAVGTPAYMAPEQADPHGKLGGVDERTDQYSLGVVLYEMLLGIPPFDAGNPLELLYKTLTEEPMPPRGINPGIPEAIEALVLTTLAKRKDSRYPNMAAFRSDLENFLEDRPIFALTRLKERKSEAIEVTPEPVSESEIKTEPEPAEKKSPEKPLPVSMIISYILLILALLAACVFYGIKLYTVEKAPTENPAGSTEKPEAGK